MLTFIAQFDSQSGPDGARSYKLRLDIDEAHRAGFLPITQHHTKGDTFLVVMIPVDDEFRSVGEAINETEDQTKSRFNRQLHALMKEKAAEKGLSLDEVKRALKEILKKKGLIEKSTKELDIKGYAAGIHIMQHDFDS